MTTEYGQDPIVAGGEAFGREPWQQTDERLATICHVSRGTVARWRRASGVPIDSADRLCGPLGVHVSAVWPEVFALVPA